MSLPQLKPIGFIPTVNADAARVFYENTLGFTFVEDDGNALVFKLGQAGDLRLRIVRLAYLNPVAFTIFGWESQNILADVDDLAARGVAFERYPALDQDEHGIWTAANGARVAWFKDPAGNVLSISQHPA